MTYDQILNSGLLELYVLGELSPTETLEMEAALQAYPELKEEIKQIENAIEKYAQIHGITPNEQVISQVINKLPNRSNLNSTTETRGSTSSGWSKWFWRILSVLLGIGLSVMLNQKSDLEQKNIDLNQLLADCQELQKGQQTRLELFNQLADKDNKILAVAATEKYPETQLYIYNNDVTDKNYLHVQNLPSINANQSYQLWSLKGEGDPIPLDVFQGDEGQFIEISHEDNTNAYAITIEPKGGSPTPTLENLIGVFALQG